MKKVLYPGSFDPITYGHMDVVEQALKVFDRVVIAVLKNDKKNGGLFNLEERKALIKKIYEDNPNVEVIAEEQKIAAVDVALINGCESIARGLRDLTDFAEEISLSALNLDISEGKVNTVAFFANPGKVTISSTAVKELFSLNKKISKFVPSVVEEAMKEKARENHEN